jgi:Transposase DDE domain group 1
MSGRKRRMRNSRKWLRRSYASFTYQAGSWSIPRRTIAKVEWHPGELYPRVGFIITNKSRLAKNVVAFYNKRGTCEQWIKEGKGAIKWTRLLCRSFAANAVRLQLHALAYNLGNFLRTLATPEDGKNNIFRSPARRRPAPTPVHKVLWRFALARNASPGQYQAEIGGYPGNVI